MNHAVRLTHLVTVSVVFPLILPVVVEAQLPALFVSTPTEIQRLEDATGDGDYLDFGEVTTFAAMPGATTGPLGVSPEALFAADGVARIVWVARDVNDDGDALDFGEISEYLDASSCESGSAWAVLAVEPSAGLLLADVDGRMFRATDVNADGDALDFGECNIVAIGLNLPRGISVMPNGAVLVAQELAAVPVVILEDRNGDGDFLDFAEHISYAESTGPGASVVVHDQWTAFLLDANLHSVFRLQDLTHDADALDTGEIVTHAGPIANAAAMTADSSGKLLVASSGPPGMIHLLLDENDDGDALDFGEVTVVATSIGNIQSLTIAQSSVPCVAGDADQDGAVDPADIPLFAEALLGQSPPIPLCAIDLNGDGLSDARDISPFIAAVLSP